MLLNLVATFSLLGNVKLTKNLRKETVITQFTFENYKN